MPPPIEENIAANLANVRERLDKALTRIGRPPEAVSLMAVTKNFPASTIRHALDAGTLDAQPLDAGTLDAKPLDAQPLDVQGRGHRLFGENKVQEAQEKWGGLRAEYPDARLHLIGALQSNKAAAAVGLFDAIHTLDRVKLARVLADEIQKQGRTPELFVQVNTGDEAQKTGVSLAALDDFVTTCRQEYGLEIAGLMCLPPLSDVPAPHFALLEKRAQNLGLNQLSMGMSADYEAALPFGTTCVRLGTAIFGSRL